MERSLKELFAGLEPQIEIPPHARDVAITAIAVHSSEAVPGALFFAVPGAKADGLRFVPDAAARGAVAVVIPDSTAPEDAVALGARFPDIAVCRTPDVRRALSFAATTWNGRPADDLLAVGVTGTNGKTSVSWILTEAFARLGRSAVYVGTLGIKHVDESGSTVFRHETPNTTPDATLIQRALAERRRHGARAAVIEVTSQGLVQRRTADVSWDAAAFTNLTRDHLDLHGTMEAYGDAKRLLFFDELRRSAKRHRVAAVNVDDPFGAALAADLKRDAGITVVTCSTSGRSGADVAAAGVDGSLSLTRIDCAIFGKRLLLESSLIGLFNVSNLLVATATLVGLGFTAERIAEVIREVPQVPGRLELVGASGVHVVVDYAHTPDALDKAQRSLRALGSGRLITVFGCGGDRDRGKRPLMAAAVEELADVAVVTSDNPRTEDPERIIADVVAGFGTGSSGRRCERIARTDRREAIREAIRIARAGDIVLIAGKGHEDYQDVGGTKHPFSDQEVCRSILGEGGA